jgi:hypothetical protein
MLPVVSLNGAVVRVSNVRLSIPAFDTGEPVPTDMSIVIVPGGDSEPVIDHPVVAGCPRAAPLSHSKVAVGYVILRVMVEFAVPEIVTREVTPPSPRCVVSVAMLNVCVCA